MGGSRGPRGPDVGSERRTRRTPLRRFAACAAANPIEVIVAIFIAVTLVYFQLLEAVKMSDFLNVELEHTASIPSRLSSFAPAVLRRADQKWTEARDEHVDVHLRQIVVSLDALPAPERRNVLVFAADPAAPSQTPASEKEKLAGLLTPEVVDELVAFEKAVRTDVDWDSQLCYKASSTAPCFAHSLSSSADRKALFPNERTYVLTLGFKADTEGEQRQWEDKLVEPSELERITKQIDGPATFQSGYVAPSNASSVDNGKNRLGFSFSLSPRVAGTEHASLREMRSVRWMAYAARAFVLRFWGLAKKADSADIAVMLIGYLLMHATFVTLYLNMRKLGSKVWLATSVLVSSVFAFLFALLAAYSLRLPVNPILLSEALPFLVIVVGFEKPILLAKTVFTNPALSPTAQATSEAYFSAPRLHSVPSFGSRRQWNGNLLDPNGGVGANNAGTGSATPAPRVGVRWAPPLPASEIVVHAVEKHGPRIVRDYLTEVAVLTLGACSNVPGLREFCRLASLILVFDCLFLFVFYVAILTVMVEIHRIRIMRGLKRVDSSADLARILDDGTTDEAPIPTSSRSPSLTLREWATKLVYGTTSGDKGTPESPAARLKLLLLISFLVLHSLNLLTTLTANTAFSRHHAGSEIGQPNSSVFSNRVDHTAPTVAPVLDALARQHYPRETFVASVAAPVHVQIYVPGLSVEGVGGESLVGLDHGAGAVPLAILDRFMSGWSRLVGDPVMSKWIVIALGVSVFLNGYLLKGLAVGPSPLGGNGTGFAPSSAAEAAARILLASTRSAIGAPVEDEDDEQRKAKLRRRWSSGDKQLPRLSTLNPDGEWSLAEAAELARTRREEMVEQERIRDAEMPSSPDTARNRRKGSQSSEDSEPPSPIFVKPRSRKSTVDGLNIPPQTSSHSSNATLAPKGPGIAVIESNPRIGAVSPAVSDHPRSSSVSSGVSDSSPTTPATTDVSLPVNEPRELEACVKLFDGGKGATLLTDEEIILMVQKGRLAAYALEKMLKDNVRAVRIRRALISRASSTKTLEHSELPYLNYNYAQVIGQCCENVIGYTPIPLGIAGPLRVDGNALPIPMATAEGALVASTSRGCKALNACGGVTTVLTADAMTRGPALEFPSIVRAAQAKAWIESEEGSTIMKAAFNSTSRFARLQSLKPALAGRTLFVRFATQTGDAMGMNMISKGTERALEVMMTEHFTDMRVVSLSGNYCIDKKPSAMNWIEGRGKSVVAEAVVSGEVVKTVLKTTVDELCRLNQTKNLVGSAMAGSIGGYNAHASNILTAIFLATGQDPAQNVESSMCMTLMEPVNDGKDLLITCTMPSIEVGCIGGGTILAPQKAMLQMLGVAGPHPTQPGENARRLARIICAAVMAGELSLMSALAAGHLVKSHLALNRSPAPTQPSTPGWSSPNSGRLSHTNSFTPLALTPRS